LIDTTPAELQPTAQCNEIGSKHARLSTTPQVKSLRFYVSQIEYTSNGIATSTE
jgi:hypothetical protein